VAGEAPVLGLEPLLGVEPVAGVCDVSDDRTAAHRAHRGGGREERLSALLALLARGDGIRLVADHHQQAGR
jgi:hypothetical protein